MPDPAERPAVPVDRLAVIAEPNAPKGITPIKPSASAEEGAAGGALVGSALVGSMADPLLVIMALPLIPVLAIADAAGGASAAQDEVAIAAGTLALSKQKSDLQGELRDRVAELLRRERVTDPIVPRPTSRREGPEEAKPRAFCR